MEVEGELAFAIVKIGNKLLKEATRKKVERARNRRA